MFIKEQFIGREDVVRTIQKRLSDMKDGYRQNVALLGEELTGKTWIIKYIISSFTNDSLLPIYLDLSQPSAEIFPQRFINTFLFAFLKAKGLNLARENSTQLLEESKRFIPLTAAKIEVISLTLKQDKIDATLFRDLLALLEVIQQETSLKPIFILDEFQNLESLKIRNAFQELGKKIMTQKNVMYIVLSSHITQAKKIIQEDLSLLFGNFEIIDIRAFDNKTSAEVIRNRLKDITISDDLIRFLIHFSGGHPFYLDKIVQHIYTKALLLKSSTVTPFVFVYGLEDILFNRWGVLCLRFQHVIDLLHSKNRPDLITLLMLLAQGKNRTKDLAAHLHCTQADVAQKLSRLIDSRLIYRTGTFYSISDRLLHFWLQFVYCEKMSNHSQHYDDQVIAFRKKIEISLQEFILYSRKDIGQRLHDLLDLFSNDSIQLGKNKFILSKFNDIQPLRFVGQHIQSGFCCSSDEELWIIGFHNGDITEGCVSEFIAESQKVTLQRKTSRKLIIGLDKTDINARLLAKEEKIATWDINHLNLLLDLYGKPRLVV